MELHAVFFLDIARRALNIISCNIDVVKIMTDRLCKRKKKSCNYFARLNCKGNFVTRTFY